MKKSNSISVLAGLMFTVTPQLSLADSPHCEKVQASSANSCQELNVQLDLSQCGKEGTSTKLKMTTHCSSKRPFAEISMGNTKYSVKIKHKATSEGWGDQKEAWTVSKKVKKHSEVAAAKKEESDADRSIAAIRPNTSVAPSGP